jgi:pyruvate ferredoxin oxidoreductase alpha subunit
MALKDAGWIQLHAETNQEAADLHIQAFRLAEMLSCPVMVCMDGFILTHAFERVDIPTQEQVDEFLPPFEPVQQLDPANPYSIGAIVGPDAFSEVRYLAHQKQMEALECIPAVAAEFKRVFGRESGGLVQPYRTDGAETIVVALGSVNGTIKEVVDQEREAGAKIGSVSICSFRPFPLAALCDFLNGAKRVICVEKSLAPGLGGILASNIRMALRGRTTPVYTVIAGLGGREITRKSLADVFERAARDNLEDLTFLDLNWDVVHKQLAHAHEVRQSGPIAENLLRALNPGLVRRVP